MYWILILICLSVVKNKTIIGLKSGSRDPVGYKGGVKNKTIIGLK
ncbi:hypothetical protein Msm_0162 [Methanobrevibacter smithii ATCC 35061]|uniref:Uncharacterized protein n=1 Tax=Methanobrevibacter smithii (strain ATCC 35061 / DSM 861 / OCM 144 / PS) TaxID=420247 RepID=A5UJI9_METS3|nr:hypothetical protein Msm_0162 [Methanobrevibacter smithii ATCC 35061]